MEKTIKPTKHSVTILNQVCKRIPPHLVNKLARDHGVDAKCRTFSPWSHVVALLYAQLSHSIGLNDVCDGLRHHEAKLNAIRGATPPSRNGLSYANKHRNADMAEALFWQTFDHLETQCPKFVKAGKYKGLPHRFNRTIHAIDSSTIALVANCMDWAKHRRSKAAAKLHLRLNLQTFLPSFAIIGEASHHDSFHMGQLCAGLGAGEIAIFDKAYVHFQNLHELHQRGVFWVTRAKDNMAYRVVKKRIQKPDGNLLRDDEIVLTTAGSRAQYPQRLRRIEAKVLIDDELVEMVFITNNFDWAPSSICDLYQSRWGIEVFFKQIKQTLKVCDFLGHSKQAIRWQLWTALLLYLLLRFEAWANDWSHSFTRLFTMIRGVLWDRFRLHEILSFYGTASEQWRMRTSPQSAYLPGFDP